MREYAARPPAGKPRRIVLRFLVSPVAILGEDRVEGVEIVPQRARRSTNGRLVARPTGATEVIPAGLVLRSVGYKGVALPGVPFDEQNGVIPNDGGRAHWAPSAPTSPAGSSAARAASSARTRRTRPRRSSSCSPTLGPGSSASPGGDLAQLLGERGVRLRRATPAGRRSMRPNARPASRSAGRASSCGRGRSCSTSAGYSPTRDGHGAAQRAVGR